VRKEENVSGTGHDNTSINSRQISSTTGLPESAAMSMLRVNQLCPLHARPIQSPWSGEQHLHPHFSQCLLQKTVDTYQFLCCVSWTDEVVSTGSGIYNPHNAGFFAEARHNPTASVVQWSELLATERRCIVFPVRYELNLYMLCRRK
jgi:hypothetical protein